MTCVRLPETHLESICLLETGVYSHAVLLKMLCQQRDYERCIWKVVERSGRDLL